MITYEPFTTWEQLLDHVSAGYPLYYHAPMDHRPVGVSATVRRDGRLRVTPGPYSNADAFNADKGHLERFRRMAGRRATSASD